MPWKKSFVVNQQTRQNISSLLLYYNGHGWRNQSTFHLALSAFGTGFLSTNSKERRSYLFCLSPVPNQEWVWTIHAWTILCYKNLKDMTPNILFSGWLGSFLQPQNLTKKQVSPFTNICFFRTQAQVVPSAPVLLWSSYPESGPSLSMPTNQTSSQNSQATEFSC